WRSEEMGELPVPTSVQALISSRLDRLEGGDKQLAHNAAVIGAVFWAGAVAHVGADEEGALPDLHPGLEILERRDFVLHGKASTRQSGTTRGRSTCFATSIPECSSTSASGAQTS